MKVGKRVYIELKIKGEKAMREVTLIAFPRGDMAKIRLFDGRELDVLKSRLISKRPDNVLWEGISIGTDSKVAKRLKRPMTDPGL